MINLCICAMGGRSDWNPNGLIDRNTMSVGVVDMISFRLSLLALTCIRARVLLRNRNFSFSAFDHFRNNLSTQLRALRHRFEMHQSRHDSSLPRCRSGRLWSRWRTSGGRGGISGSDVHPTECASVCSLLFSLSLKILKSICFHAQISYVWKCRTAR